MTTTFETALKAARAQNSKPQDKSKASPIEVTVRLIEPHNEIEVHFNRYPGDAIITDLKANFFRWTSSCWVNDDTEKTRQFCRERFNAKLEPKDEPIDVTPEVPAPLEIEVLPKPITPQWEAYCKQVDWLISHLKTDMADLQLLAIRSLYDNLYE